jgi:Ca2+/H+ antiporter
MWVSCGLKGAVILLGAVVFIVVLAELLAKWIEFVDKHIKD